MKKTGQKKKSEVLETVLAKAHCSFFVCAVALHHCAEMDKPALTLTQLAASISGDGLKRDYVSGDEISPI
jgi:hypothetical protein